MKVFAKLVALTVLSIGAVEHTATFAAPLKSDKVMKDLVRQCEYVDGLIVRVLASRECPVIEATTPAPAASSVPAVLTSPSVVAANPPADQSVNGQTSDDIIFERAIGRCTTIGFKRDTAEFRSCVTEQIAILSK